MKNELIEENFNRMHIDLVMKGHFYKIENIETL